MCVIVHKPEDVDIDEYVLRACWDDNKDGAGIMYSSDNVLHIEKGFMRFKKFFKAYNRLKDKELVIHFRYATHGSVDKNMTHPFLVNNNLGVMHNGIIFISERLPEEASDSYYFTKLILQKMPDNFLENPAIVELIRCRIGRSILVFMDNKGKVTKFGYKSEGITYKDCWFSSSYWMIRKEINLFSEMCS